MDQVKIGKYIAQKRREKGYTQNFIASKLLLTDKAISKWERGICMPNIELLPILAELLEVEVDEILEGEDRTEKNIDTSSKTSKDCVPDKKTRISEKHKAIMLGLIFTIFVGTGIILSFFHMDSKHNVDTREAWVDTSGCIIDLIDAMDKIINTDYLICQNSLYEVTYSLKELEEKSIAFQDKTLKGEKLYSLAEKELKVVTELSWIARDVSVYYEENDKEYMCSKKEKIKINDDMLVLMEVYNQINEEFEINAPELRM